MGGINCAADASVVLPRPVRMAGRGFTRGPSMSHEDTLLIVAAIMDIAWAVRGVAFVLAVGLVLRARR